MHQEDFDNVSRAALLCGPNERVNGGASSLMHLHRNNLSLCSYRQKSIPKQQGRKQKAPLRNLLKGKIWVTGC